MDDIVERLRLGRETCGFDMCRTREARSGCTCAEAADEIERLREALQPFACKCEGDWCENLRFNDDKAKCEHYIARAALEEKQ